ncbi:hypothetical protein PENSPDRAFT_507586 [Peniophora sp. CONT]|nr:hypothetical protein PENSPDRAFT_507586 [Peniophora sp. CONT]
MSYLPPNYYLTPGWIVTPPPTDTPSRRHRYSSSHPSPAPASIFIPSPPTNSIPLPGLAGPPSPGFGPVYPHPDPRARRHSFDASYGMYSPSSPWPYPPSPYLTPYSWNHNAPRSLPTPMLHALLDGTGALGSSAHAEADLSAYHLVLYHRRHHLSSAERDAPATSPALVRLRIICDAIPQWPIDISLVGTTITPSRPERPAIGCITVGDVLHAVHAGLQTQITHDEWARLTPAQEVEVSRSYTRRYKAYAPAEFEVRRGGVRRVDYLGRKCFFKGLVMLTPENGVERARLVLDDHASS